MTQEEKLKEAKRLYKTANSDQRYVLESLFPELKESEDEKVRKELLNYVIKGKESYYDIQQYGLEKFENWIAWLEERDKSAEINPDEIIEECYQDNADHIIDIVTEQRKPAEWSKEDENKFKIVVTALVEDHEATLELINWFKSLKERVRSKQGEQTSLQTNECAWLYLVSDVLTWKDGIGQYLDDPRVQELAKKLCSEYAQKLYNSVQDAPNEQKPIEVKGKTALEAIEEENVDNANKVESKFHEGEWVVWQDKCYKVNCNGCGYEFVDQNGLSTSLEYGTIDENAHLWTINDAVVGDILADESDNPFIYCGHDPSYWKYLTAYCGISFGEFTVYDKPFLWSSDTVEPATQEQRDSLLQKMKESGYAWNSEKKELKKI